MKYNTQGPAWSLSRFPFLAILPAFAAGILLQQQLSHTRPLTWTVSTLLFIAAALPLSQFKTFRSRINIVRTTIMLVAFICLGATTGSLADVRNNRSWYGHFIEQAEALKVKVVGESSLKKRTVLVPVVVTAVCRSGHWVETEGNTRLYFYRKNSTAHYLQGQVLLIPNSLTPIRNSGNPFSFDLRENAAHKGVFHQAFLSPDEVYDLHPEEARSSPLERLKKTLQHSIDQTVKDSTTRALIAATLLNERSELDDELMAAYSNTGIIHIIAISGMHIVLLAACILWLLKFIPSTKMMTFKYGAAIMLVWMYVALTGFPPSAVRAAVMFSLASIGICLNRLSNPINIWAAAGLLVLSYNPYWLYDVGIQLSFLAVLSILLFYNPVKNWINPSTRAVHWLWEIIAVSISAQILVFPLVIYYFHQFPLLGIVANVPAALYSTLLMFGAILLFLLCASGLPVAWLGTLLTGITKIFNSIILFLSDCTPQLMRSLQIDGFEYWLMMLIIILLCFGCLSRKGALFLYTLTAAILFTADLAVKDYTTLHQRRLIVYNTNKVSQADLIIGNKACHLYKVDSLQLKYAISPAMLGYGIDIETAEKAETNKLISINGANVLFLDKCSIDTTAHFPVDYLVVSKRSVFNTRQWFRAFHPKKIILDGSLPRYKAIQWKKELTASGAQVHWVQEDGPWIYPGDK